MATDRDIIEKGIEAALDLASSRSWSELTLKQIAELAGLSLSDFNGRLTKDLLAMEVDPFLDRFMSAEPVDMSDDARTRLFDVIMLRFEAMEDRRDGIASWIRARDSSPRMLMERVSGRSATAKWALVSAGLDNDTGAPMPAKVLAIAWVVAQTERAWKKETSADFSRTMAALDKELRKAEERMGWLDVFKRRGDRSDAEPADNDVPPQNSDEPDIVGKGTA